MPTVAPTVSTDTQLAASSTPLLGAADAAGIAPVFGLQPIGDLVDAAPLSPLADITTVIEAAGGGAEVSWAAGMVRTGAGSHIVITTDRGRSWLPDGVQLPKGIAFPWDHPGSEKWAGLLDPARVILEYAAAVGGTLIALASTRNVPALAAGIPSTIVDTSRRAHPEKISDAANRNELQVRGGLLQTAAKIAPEKQRGQAANLAANAALIARRIGIDIGVRRTQLHAVLHSELSERDLLKKVSDDEWAQLRAEHEQLCAQERALRADVRDIPVGELDTSGGACHDLLVNAYCLEALLAVNHQTAQGALDAALYAWNMTRTASPAAVAVAAALNEPQR